MNYDEKFDSYSNWENQCNFPDDWNCDCKHNHGEYGKQDDKKYFYGYFVGTEINNGCKQSARHERRDCNDQPKYDRCNHKQEETCDNNFNHNCQRQNNCRRCNCGCFNLFRRF